MVGKCTPATMTPGAGPECSGLSTMTAGYSRA
jgi:hypothetical protein